MSNYTISKLKAIEIQTVSYCNSKCIVCPWIKIKDFVSKQNMTENTWSKVLEGISMLNIDTIIPYMNNEPLLDNNIEYRINDLHSLSPHSQIEVSTNGILLSEKSAKYLVENVDIILISLFGSDEKSNLELMGKGMSYEKIKNNIINLKKIRERSGSNSTINIVKLIGYPLISNEVILKDKSFWKNEEVDIRYYDFVDRSSNVGDFKQRNKTVKPFGCDFNRHIERTYIHSNGDVSFCCHDWKKEYIMGNINENRLIDILNGEKYNRIRKMVDGIIESDDDFLCKKCFHCRDNNTVDDIILTKK